MKGQAVSYEARVENLPALLYHVERTCERAGLGLDIASALRLAVEEVCVNVIKHGYAGKQPGPIHLACEADAREVRVTVTDEAAPFDPDQLLPPDLEVTWEDRPLGGLGWHLVRQMVDEVRHEVTAFGGNQLTLVKKLPRGPGTAVY